MTFDYIDLIWLNLVEIIVNPAGVPVRRAASRRLIPRGVPEREVRVLCDLGLDVFCLLPVQRHAFDGRVGVQAVKMHRGYDTSQYVQVLGALTTNHVELSGLPDRRAGLAAKKVTKLAYQSLPER